MAARGATRCPKAIFAALICGLLTTASARAENVPLPTPAPFPKTGTAPTQPSRTSTAPVPPASVPPASVPTVQPAPVANTAPADSQPKGFFPFTQIQKGLQALTGQNDKFDAKQHALLDRISLYLSSAQTLVGNFVQIGPDGNRTEGSFYIQKPGRVRFNYNPPSPIDIIADGSSVVVRDRRLATQDLFPLSQTPLRYLLAERIDLLHDTNVVSVSTDDTFATVTIEEKELMIGTSRLMMMFDAKDLTLKQWTVTDPQGFDTTVAVYNLDATKKPDPNLFVINYDRNSGISNQ
jgi:outer membrane lipoprotein-sorting protein